MSENTTPAAVGSSEELGQRLFEAWQRTDHAELDGCHTLTWREMTEGYRDAWRSVAAEATAAVSAERERWQQAAKAVIESHDAALAYVYERLRSQGVRGITIHDTAAAEIRAVNALRELVQPNAQAERRLTAPQEVKDESK